MRSEQIVPTIRTATPTIDQGQTGCGSSHFRIAFINADSSHAYSENSMDRLMWSLTLFNYTGQTSDDDMPKRLIERLCTMENTMKPC